MTNIYPLHVSEFSKWYQFWNCIDSFKTLEEITAEYDFPEFYKIEDFEHCPRCGEQPRLWIFDNGRYAACKCFEQYSKVAVEAPSIGDCFRQDGHLKNYRYKDLSDSWNYFCFRMKNDIMDLK